MDPSTSDINSSNVPNNSAENNTEVEAGTTQPEENPLHVRRKSKPKVHIGKHLCVDTSKQSLTRFDLILLETFQDESLNEGDGKPCSSCCHSFDTGDSQNDNEDCCDDYSVSSSSLSSTSTFVDQFRAIRDLANLAEEEEEEQENDEREQNCRMEFTDRLFRMSTDGEKSGEDLCAEEKDSGSESLPPNAAQFEEDIHPCEDKDGCTLNGRSLVQEQSPRDGQTQHCAARFNSNWSDKIPSYRKKSNPSSIPPRLESTTASSGFSSGSYSSSNGPGISTTGGGIANAAVHLLNGVLSLPPNSELSSNSNATMEQAHSKIGSYRPPLAAGQATQPVPTKMPHHARLVRRHSTCQPDRINSAQSLSTLRLNNAHHHSTGGEFPGIELESTAYQSPGRANGTCDSASACLMKELLCDHDNGLEMAFDRCKAWSKYAGHLLSFMRSRLSLEHDHVRNMQKLADQTKSLLVADSNNNYLPLVNIFDELMDNSLHFSNRAEKTINTLQHRFICTLENRQKEHDLKRRKLKSDWAKQKKQLDTCADELRRARQNLNAKEGGYVKARDSTLRHEQSVPPMGLPSNVDPQKKRKELEKKRKTEEDAFIRKTDAENEVARLERELEARKIGLSELRLRIIGELCDLIRHCDLTTTACASHFFKAFADLFAPVPEDYEKLAHLTIHESPGSEYMAFLQSQNFPARSVSTSSLPRADKCGDSDKNSFAQCRSPYTERERIYMRDRHHSSANMASAPSACSSSMTSANDASSPSMPNRRRNALNADEHEHIIAETTQRRQKKSMTRLFEQSSSSSVEPSDAAKSHQLQRTRQVTKCAQCEHYVVFDAVKCLKCAIIFHKKCLGGVNISCGPSAITESSAQRRMSIFGVSLQGHLEAQHRKIPLILEKCVDELQKRGMTCKGLYRTCGVKSKIEQICVSFEQTGSYDDVDLSDVHPMNIASVVKLYLRRLPEPLFTYDLYKDCTGNGSLDLAADPQSLIQGLKDLVSQLPQQNYDTLRYLMLHLKRVTWFEVDNLMTASNLAAVIAPSLIWQRSCPTATSREHSYNICSSFINDAHQQTKVVELLVQNAFEIFDVDRIADWKEFFNQHPDVKEPKLVDPETEADIEKKANMELDDDGDCLEDEEEYDICEEYPDMPSPANNLCSSSARDISNGSKIANSQGIVNNGQNANGEPLSAPIKGLYNKKHYPSVASPSSTRHSTSLNPYPKPASPRRAGKQRSFTTSILVSPQSDRKFAILPQKQLSMDEDAHGRNNQNWNDIEKKRVLRSGEVVVDIKKDQYCSPSYSSGRGSKAGKLSSASFNTPQSTTEIPSADSASYSDIQRTQDSRMRRRRLERSSNNAAGCMDYDDRDHIISNAYKSSDQNAASKNNVMDPERVCLQSVGVLFSGSDVSYV